MKNNKEYELLKKNVLTIALKYLEQCEPGKTKEFRDNLKLTHNPGIAENVFKGMQIANPYRTWREIFIDVVDVDLQLCRVENSLTLLNSLPPQDFPLGEWVEYHYCAWPILTQSLLYRVEKLAKDMIRDIIKPTNHKEYELAILKPIDTFKNKLSPTRHSIAHTRGAIEAIKEDNIAELVIVVGGYNSRDMFKQMGDHQLKWYKMFQGSSEQIFSAIMTVCKTLNKAVNWNIV